MLRDFAKMMFVGRSINGGSQADVAHDVFAVRKAGDRPEDDNRSQCGQRTDAGMRPEAPCLWVGTGTGAMRDGNQIG